MRTYGVARALAMNGGVTLLYARFGASHPDPAFQVVDGIELCEVRASRGARRLAAYARARAGGVPRNFARGVSPELLDAARRLADAPGRARVIADGPVAAAALAPLAAERPVIYNAHNLESGFRGELRGDAHGLRNLHAFERRLLARASESWMVSEADMRAARELCPAANLRLAPNVVDVTAIQPVRGPAPEPRAIFVADFAYEPNRNALRFLCEQVMPRVWERLPDARLMLVGGGLRGRASEDPRVEQLGFVEALSSAYARARCVVVPLLQGGGSPLKLIEALAYGLPIVATPRALAGVQARDGEHLIVAEGAGPFAGALVTVLADGAPQLAANARRLAQERYSIEALAALLR
jgi:glycosyltransferase involved in cell wall biosynthesis